jgi:hypothetical protein
MKKNAKWINYKKGKKRFRSEWNKEENNGK